MSWLPGKMRRWLKKYLIIRRAHAEIRAAGHVDALLVVNPSQLDQGLVLQAQSAAKLTIAYLSDGIARLAMPLDQLATFDKVYTFDGADAREYQLRKLYNYIYEEHADFKTTSDFKAFVVMGGKHRVDVLGRVAQAFEQLGYSSTCKFLVQSKPVPGASPLLTFFRQRMGIDETAEYVRRSEILIDIVRPGHAGLSFRFFEALLYRKKMITNNASVADYDFYDPRNILIIDSDHPVIPESFISGEYVDPPEEVVQRYSMASWTNEVFSSPPAGPNRLPITES
ncbi:hypothetical protein ACQKEN_00950 [Pseudomonas sp. NPDC078416]|uniref:hypothetical protein n=1 Tax=Pseudomonas sp. NPDC078416 TaxID=3390637 RepID=UPI003D08D1B0